ncbi:MAG: MBL fold metallo-hydrolase [Halobaculum sp.]
MIENVASGVAGMTSNAFLVWDDEAGGGVAGDGVSDGAEGARGDGVSADSEDAGRRVLVDCGANFDAVAAVRDHVERLDGVVLTHTHPDHVGTLGALRAAFDVETWGYDAASEFVDHGVSDGDRLQMGNGVYEVIHTPGHKNDHVCLYDADGGVLFAGDLVFAGGGFGRTDLAEGDRGRLIDSIERLSERVGRVTALHAGHGPSVTDGGRDVLETALRAARR